MFDRVRLALPLLAAMLPLALSGENGVPPAEGGQDRFFQEFMNMLTTLGILVAAIFLVSWFLKKMVNTRIQQANTTSQIKILERRTLSPKANIYLIEVNGKQLVVGETASGVSALAEFPTD